MENAHPLDNYPLEGDDVLQPEITIQQVEFEITQLDKADSSKNNIKTAFNKMVKLGLIDLYDARSQFSSSFDRLMQNVKLYVTENKVSKSWPSFLNDIQVCVNNILNFDLGDKSFGVALLVLLKKKYGKHLSHSKLTRYVSDDAKKEGVNISADNMRKWIRIGSTRKPKCSTNVANQIEFLDRYLGANGALKYKADIHSVPIRSTSSLTRECVKLPSKLLEDVNKYIAYKKDGVAPRGQESSLFKKLNPKERMTYKISINTARWQKASSGVVTSEIGFIRKAKSFTKYIQLEHPEILEELSFKDFFDDQLLSGYFSYQLSRGALNSAESFFGLMSSECKPKSFVSVYVSSEGFCEHKEWIEYLALLKVDLTEYIKVCKKRIELDGGRNVEWILDGDIEPSVVCNEISKALYNRTKTVAVNFLYSTWRSFVMFEILRVRPIRLDNYASLEYIGKLNGYSVRQMKKKPCVTIYLDEDLDCYCLFVHKQMLKNRDSENVTNIHQPLPHLTRVIGDYLKQREFQLERYNAESTRFSLASDMTSESIDVMGGAIGNAFNLATYKAIRIAFPNNEEVETGINPHAMRHLDASMYLRDNPENYTGLATLLMDELQTVIKIYARRDDKGNVDKISNWAQNNYKSPFDE
jgi:hypothetical protein